jgi:hypothetical protein
MSTTHRQNSLMGTMAAAQGILLGVVERGLGAGMSATVNRDRLRVSLGLDENDQILQVIALGESKEEVRLVLMEKDGDQTPVTSGKEVRVLLRPIQRLEALALDRCSNASATLP